MPIRELEARVAAGIAAGEVIERPASVVKELLENALDAGAGHVTVEIQQGGLAHIRVADDGCGIDADDLPIAFRRHATSKLSSLDDLDSLATLGFRGEALPSIAAAARVRMSTRTPSANGAAFIELNGGNLAAQGTEGGAPGTIVAVDALFSSIPARLKFLRSVPSEAGRVRLVVEQLALANPHVAFTLITDKRTVLETPGNGVLKDTFAVLFGHEQAEALLELAPSSNAAYKVEGLVGLPSLNRPNRVAIRIFVNRRWVQSRSLTVAIEEAYTGMLMEGRYPVAVVLLTVPPHEVDVNVHPNKREVRFVREGDAFASVQRTVRETLTSHVPVGAARTLTPVPTAMGTDSRTLSAQGFDFTVALGEAQASLLPLTTGAPTHPVPVRPLSRLRILGQIANTYIVAEGPDGMYLVDQHAAHESVLFYQLLHRWDAGAPEVQPLLEPMPIELSPDEQDTAASAGDELHRLGLQLERFGESTWLLRTVPAGMERASPEALLHGVLAAPDQLGGSQRHWAMAASIACHGAIRAGQTLGAAEMERLIEALENAADPTYCPHGRPTTVKLTTSMLEREFGRA